MWCRFRILDRLQRYLMRSESGLISGFRQYQRSKMKEVEEKRCDQRWEYMGSISFSYFNKEPFFNAQMLNYGPGGICFKSNLSLKPGTIVFIRLIKSNSNGFCNGVSGALRSVTLAEVKWCKKMDDIDVPAYGVGVAYIPPIY
jgi:hypothetical protein